MPYDHILNPLILLNTLTNQPMPITTTLLTISKQQIRSLLKENA